LRHYYNLASGLRDLLRALTERRQVFPAERSAEMAKECDNDRPLSTQLGEGHIFSVPAAEGDIRGRFAQVDGHALRLQNAAIISRGARQ